jgi:tryptophan-rich sensory protein
MTSFFRGSLLAILFLFSLLSRQEYVDSFAFIPRARNIPRRQAKDAKFHLQRSAPKSSVVPRTHSALDAVSPVVWSAIGHVLGGTIGVPVVANGIKTWYKKVDLPSWTPPDRIFAPTWTLLYALMGVAAGRVYQRVGKTLPIFLWTCHYLLNLSWAPVFFGRKRLRLGLLMNITLWSSLGYIIPRFYQIDPLSGKLLLPYWVWLTFATALNWSICSRNPTEGGYNNAMFQSDLDRLQQQAAEYAGI